MPHRRLSRRAALAGHLVLGPATAAAAAPGDPRRVAAERVSLEAAPAGDAAVRRRLRRGEGLLGREGGWCAVRVARAGEEGRVAGGLVERVARSTPDVAAPRGGPPRRPVSRAFACAIRHRGGARADGVPRHPQDPRTPIGAAGRCGTASATTVSRGRGLVRE